MDNRHLHKTTSQNWGKKKKLLELHQHPIVKKILPPFLFFWGQNGPKT
jgi:hypothetical protein